MKKASLIFSLCLGIFSQVSFKNPSAQAKEVLDH